MAMFLGIHDTGKPTTDDQLQTSWEAYKMACDKLGCKASHVHRNAEKGRAYCLTEAPSAEEVQKAHDEAGVQINEIIEVVTAQ